MTSAMQGPRQTSSKQWPENFLGNVTFDFKNKSKCKHFTLALEWTTSETACGIGAKLR